MKRLPDTLQEGRHEPMGSHARDGGVNFAVFSDHAQRIELCLFDADGVRELRRYPLHGPHDGVFHGFLLDASPGLVYGLRAHGPYAPEQGHRFNRAKLLLDPAAREIVGAFRWREEHYGHTLGHPDGHRSLDARDNAALALKARVAPPDTHFAPHGGPRLSPAQMVLYEVHVKGFSQQHPGIPAELRGTYAGLAHPAALAHFKALGVTTLSLLPVQYHLDEPALAARGASNYWGYNTLGFFCPDPGLAQRRDDPSAVAAEFRRMVATLHAHGLEVVLDVVYNHTPEAGETGPTLSFRGLDNASWYRLDPEDRSRCENLTGCGNTVNVAHPRITQFVLDSLRYWVQEMGVDGFRFDLAPVLGRTRHGFDSHAAFFTALRQDPVLARVHLIAEPWDAGYDGYQVGRFPGRFMEWNDKFRDTVRCYWLGPESGKSVGRGELARRFTASSDLFHHGQRRPSASVNFIAVHDGFTLADLVSYSGKHNLANGENNRDGRDHEPCANFGVEGPTDDDEINALRLRVRRAMMATLVLAQGTPMLCAGDEFGNSQQGNNNAYCQNNRVGWLDWAHGAQPDERAFQAFVAELIALRRSEPALRHDRWFRPATPVRGGTGLPSGERSLSWHTPSGREMTVADWHDNTQHAFSCQILGSTSDAPEPRLLLAFNPETEATAFALPPGLWQVAIDSSGEHASGTALPAVATVDVPARALMVLRSAVP
ncbi:glycogen debranching protein GlgX [Aquabacterium sp.]|uniref:glycogen debranching protein GlgX n=1 Tax=Aquabacterium sp. TaxID=1872578 RepID=UPI002BBBC38B|nr:glycogen debranching protein GlgX [Aquabacterium sp.]HSW08176.1 glycogen debranching protein GlgX [Aquabacterium sp.]